jgi:outer membrane protein TolC
MNRLLLASIMILPAMLPGSVQGETVIWAPPPLAAIIDEGLEQNQDIQSLQAQVEASRELIPFAGSLEDLRLGFAVLNLPTDSFDFNQEAMTQKQVFVAQKVPWFGKLDLRSQRQGLEATRQIALLEAKKLELARKIAFTYYEIGLTAKSLEINKRLTDMVSQLLRVAETRYASGMGLQQDVLQAQVELSKLLDEKIMLGKKRRILEDNINALLNRESFSSIKAPERPAYPALKLEVDLLQKQVLEDNPWLKVRLASIDRATVEIKLAQKDYWPDMDFKVAYGQREDSETGQERADFLSGSVVFKIPLWQKNRQDKKLSASKKKHEAALKAYRNLAATLPHRVDAIATEIADIQKNYRLYVDALMVQAEQWAHSALAAYEVGKVEFNTMIKARVRLLRLELQAERYLFQIYQKRAELEEVLGSTLKPPAPTDETAWDTRQRNVSGIGRTPAHTTNPAKNLPKGGERYEAFCSTDNSFGTHRSDSLDNRRDALADQPG